MYRSSRKTNGFTLVEVLVTLAIIGILASIAMVSLNSAREKARDAKRQSEVQEIAKALWLYYLDNNSMPENINLDTCGSNYTNAMQTLVDGNYLPSIPEDPGSQSYCYHNYGPNTPQGAMLRVVLESAQPSTGYPGTCRPFTGANWCRSDVADTQYCLCLQHEL